MNAKVSIIVPVYNTEKLLPRCMESLLNQTLKEVQIILVNDGSTDNSGELCENYANIDKRVRVIHQKNKGLGLARNTGLAQAAGEYISFVDSDDYIWENMYERMYNAAIKVDADMVLSGIWQIGGNLFANSGMKKKICCFEKEEIFLGKEGQKKLLLGTVGALPEEMEDSRYNFSVCKNIYRRSIIAEHKIKFQSERRLPSEDVLFGIDFISHVRKAIGIPGAYYCYCRNNDSITKANIEEPYKKYKKLMEEIYRKLANIIQQSDYQIYTDRMFQARARTAIVQEILCSETEKKELIIRLKSICKDIELQEVLKRYPFWRLPVKQAVFAIAMRFCMVKVLYCLVQLKMKGSQKCYFR